MLVKPCSPLVTPQSRPVQLEVEVEVDPELFDCRGSRAEPVRLPTGAAATDEARRAVARIVAFMLDGIWE